MNKVTKRAVISAAALLVLGAVLAALLIFLPKGTDDNHSDENVPTVNVTDKKRENVKSVAVENKSGSFLFTRAEKTVDSNTEFYWTSGEMLGVKQDETLVNALVGGLASLSRQPLVEENADNLEKYGLENPLATVNVTFDDGTDIKLYFGISNPSNNSYYFRTDDNNVTTADKETVSGVFNDIRDFAELTLTESLSDTNVERVLIERKDFETPVEIRYMSEILLDDDFVSATQNTHKFVSPFTAEVDESAGSAVYNDLCSLKMKRCIYLEKSAENLEKCGLTDPYAVVNFTLGTNEYRLIIGDEVKEDNGQTTVTTGYYAALDQAEGIFEIAKDEAVWRTFSPEKLISKRPLSPYIYYVTKICVKADGKEYEFDIDGENKKFFYDGNELDIDNFRNWYQQIIGSYGEEYYTDEVSGNPVVSVKFSYTQEYSDKYGCTENTVEFYSLDERKCAAVLDGKPIFKVSAIYAQRIAENVLRLINGEDIKNL